MLRREKKSARIRSKVSLASTVSSASAPYNADSVPTYLTIAFSQSSMYTRRLEVNQP